MVCAHWRQDGTWLGNCPWADASIWCHWAAVTVTDKLSIELAPVFPDFAAASGGGDSWRLLASVMAPWVRGSQEASESPSPMIVEAFTPVRSSSSTPDCRALSNKNFRLDNSVEDKVLSDMSTVHKLLYLQCRKINAGLGFESSITRIQNTGLRKIPHRTQQCFYHKHLHQMEKGALSVIVCLLLQGHKNSKHAKNGCNGSDILQSLFLELWTVSTNIGKLRCFTQTSLLFHGLSIQNFWLWRNLITGTSHAWAQQIDWVTGIFC